MSKYCKIFGTVEIPGLMTEREPLDAHSKEKLGVWVTPSMRGYLKTALERVAFRLYHQDSPGELDALIQSAERPHMMILEASLLLGEKGGQGLEQLKASLLKFDIPSLVLASSMDEINRVRGTKWPNVQFYYGATNGSYLAVKISNLLQERLLLQRPSVAIVSQGAYVRAQFEMMLMNYGIRSIPVSVNNSKDLRLILDCESPGAVIFDITTINQDDDMAHSILQDRGVPVFYVSEAKDLEGEWTALKTRQEEVFHIEEAPQLVEELICQLKKRRGLSKIERCRDLKTGLFLPPLFLETIEREMNLSYRSGSSFSIVKISMGDLEAVRINYGDIFAQSLQTNVGLFVKNRVRCTDMVCKSNNGHVVLLLSGVNQDLATLICERIRHSFKKAAAFADDSSSFDPVFEYSVFSYPHSLHSIEDIKNLFKGNSPHEKEDSALAEKTA